jgi:hypothetical protein
VENPLCRPDRVLAIVDDAADPPRGDEREVSERPWVGEGAKGHRRKRVQLPLSNIQSGSCHLLARSTPRLFFVEKQSKLHPERFAYVPERHDSRIALA